MLCSLQEEKSRLKYPVVGMITTAKLTMGRGWKKNFIFLVFSS